MPREINEAERLVGLSTTKDYIDALAQIVPFPPEREEYLRRKLWWVSSDHLRREGDAPTLEVDAARGDMERLLALLPDTARIMERIELCRQLERFQEALDLIPSVPADQRVKAHQQQRWAKAGDSTMRVILSRL